MLTLKGPNENETDDDTIGKTLILAEHSISSLLKYEEGVVHEHGLFQVKYYKFFENLQQ